MNKGNEKILTKRVFIRNTAPESIQDFFNKVLWSFGNELNILANQMYYYKEGIDKKPGYNDVFALIERSYFGILNNAVIRSFPSNAALQEFSVYSDQNKNAGRADYLVTHNFKGKLINILFEGKAEVANWKTYSEEQTKVFYQNIYNQLEGYYKAEAKYYEGETHLVTIVFEWIRNIDLLNEILKEEYVDDKISDYYYIYHTNEAGLMVYGTFLPPNDKR